MSNSIAAALSQYPSFVNDLTQYLNSTLSSLLPDTDSLPDLVTYITSLLSDADSGTNAQSLSEALQPFLEDSTASVVEQLVTWCETEVKQIKEQEKRTPAANGNRPSITPASASSIAPVAVASSSPVAAQQQPPNASPNPSQHQQPTRKRRGDDEETDETSDLDLPLPSSAKRSKGEDGLPRAQQQQQPTKPCFDFNRTGTCSRGAQCRYSHSMPNTNTNGHNSTGFRNPAAPWMNQGMPVNAMNPQQMMMQQQRQFQMMMAMQQQQAMQMQFMQQQQLQAAAAAAAKPNTTVAASSTSAPSAHSSCKVLLSKLPASLYNSAALTEWLESMGDVVNTRAVAPDQCVVQFRSHEDARAVYESKEVAGSTEVKKQWIVPRGTKAEATAGTTTNGNQPPVIQIERKGGKPITVKRKSREDVDMTQATTNPLVAPLAFMPIMTPSSFGFPNAMSMMQQQPAGVAFPKKSFAAAAATSQPQKPPPKSALDVAALIAQRKSVSAPSSSSTTVSAATTAPASASSAAATVNPANKLAGTPLASLKSLLTQTELMHTKLSNIANESNASIRTTLLKKMEDIKTEISRKEKLESSTTSPTISAASSSHLPAALQLPSPHSNPLLARSSSFPNSPGSASGSPSPSRPLTPQENALRAKKETAAKKAAAEKESKRKLDMEMDQMKKESQLATISEAE